MFGIFVSLALMEGREKEFTISLVFLDTAFLKELKPHSYFMLKRSDMR